MTYKIGITVNSSDDDIDVFAKPVGIIGKKDKNSYVIAEDAAILPPMASFCECELAVNEDGQAMVIHTKPLPEGIHWVEYDMDLSLLTFVSWSGSTMELGMKVHAPFRKYLKMAKEVMMVELKDNNQSLGTIYPAKLMVRNIGI